MKRKTKTVILLTLIVLLPVVFVIYYSLWYHPREINSCIFTLDKNIAAHDAEIWTVRYSHNGKFFITGSVDSTAKLWNDEGRLIRTFKQPAGVTALDINANDSLLVTSSYDGNIRVWDINTGALLRTVKEQEGTVWTTAFHLSTNMIAAAGDDGIIRIINAETGEIKNVLKGHERNVWIVKFTPAGKLISGSFDKSIRIWDVEKAKEEKTIVAHTQAVVDIAVSSDGSIFASSSDDKTIKLWHADGTLITTLTDGDEHVQALAFSHDGKYMISGGRDKDMPGELIQNFLGDSKRNKGVSMRLWELQTYTVIQTFSQHANDLNDCVFSPDDKHILTASADHTTELWKKSR